MYIPGSITVPDREFMYLEYLPGDTFTAITDAALAMHDHLVGPSHGGVVEEHIGIHIDHHLVIQSISYKGDLNGWRQKFIAYCIATNRVYGIVADMRLPLSNGMTCDLLACTPIKIS
jgi:hypothetical protein